MVVTFDVSHGLLSALKFMLVNMYSIVVTLDVSHALMSMLLSEAQVQVRHSQ